MSDSPPEKEIPVLSHAAHEVRNSISVALGYTGFVLRDRNGTLSDQHREWLETARKACAKLTDLANEMSDLAKLESGDAGLVRTATDLRTLLAGVIASLPAPDRPIEVELSTGDGPAMVNADTSRLKDALISILVALRRAVPDTKLLVEERIREEGGKPVSWIVVGDVEKVKALRHATTDSLSWFNRSVGNMGISLWTATWVLHAHGGSIWSPGDGTKTAAVVTLPLSNTT